MQEVPGSIPLCYARGSVWKRGSNAIGHIAGFNSAFCSDGESGVVTRLAKNQSITIRGIVGREHDSQPSSLERNGQDSGTVGKQT